VVTWVGVRVRNGFWYVGTPTAYWAPGISELFNVTNSNNDVCY